MIAPVLTTYFVPCQFDTSSGGTGHFIVQVRAASSELATAAAQGPAREHAAKFGSGEAIQLGTPTTTLVVAQPAAITVAQPAEAAA